MKKVAIVVVLFLGCWFFSDATFSKCKPGNKTAEIELVVTGNSFSYAEKEDDPIPCIFRKRDIKVEVKFYGTDYGSIVMRNFHAQSFFNNGNGWTRDDEEDLVNPLKMTVDGTPDQTQIEFINPGSATPVEKTIVFQGTKQSGAAHGPNRLITFDLAFKDEMGAEVMVFDPPWGERP